MCRRCRTPAPAGSPAELYELGWNEGLCPSCRAERNARAFTRAGEIAAGVARLISDTRGWTNVRQVTIRELPSMTIRSAWAIGDGGAARDMSEVWGELGEGFYLMTTEGMGARLDVVVNVDEDGVDIERVAEDDISAVVELAARIRQAPIPAPIRQLN